MSFLQALYCNSPRERCCGSRENTPHRSITRSADSKASTACSLHKIRRAIDCCVYDTCTTTAQACVRVAFIRSSKVGVDAALHQPTGCITSGMIVLYSLYSYDCYQSNVRFNAPQRDSPHVVRQIIFLAYERQEATQHEANMAVRNVSIEHFRALQRQ